jgi:uncharacterized RDD family membrane protein YckC
MNTYSDHYYDQPERVGFGRRFAAMLLDNFIVAIIAVILAFTVGTTILRVLHLDDDTEFSIFSDTDSSDDEAEEMLQSLNINTGMIFVLATVNNLVMFLYSLIELFTNASLGKRLMGIAIGSDEGTPASRTLLLRRWALKYGMYALVLIPFSFASTIGSILSFLITCGCLLALGAQRQALHDMAVHSAVYFRGDV